MTALTTGSRLGPYEIVEPIGAGGMGEVYKATDTRLDRVVAIKVLPPHWAEDPEMKQRFEREAQTIASLKHPHICVLHDIGRQDGTGFLVMEYMDGETLARRLERGPLPLDDALKVAIAIADALDKAHRQGIVHRDVKPSNVMLTQNGPKLLDFGLAKLKAPRQSGVAAAPPHRSDITTPGAILGTLQYMAPEQIEGIDADARTDIFAFGAMVHEIITGKKAFEGKSQVLLMSAIAASDPEPISKTQPAAPAALVHVVKTCLAKDPKDRWQTARDLLAELEWVAAGGAETVVATHVPAALRKRQTLLRALLAAVVLVGAATAWSASLYWRRPAETEFRFLMPAVGGAQPTPINLAGVAGGQFAVSPDGRSIAYVFSAGPDPAMLYVRPVGSVTPQRLAGTEGATQPFWSADSRSIAFAAGGKIRKVEATGGLPQDLCDLPEPPLGVNSAGGAWNGDGTIVLGSTKGLFRVSAQGGKPEAITTLDASETGHYFPSFLPDGRHYLYTAWSGESSKRAIFVGALDSKDKTRIVAAESQAQYVEPGFLLFRRQNTVYAQPLDAKKLALSGEPVRVADDITVNAATGRGRFSASQNGVLAYYYFTNGAPENAPVDDWERQLVWADRMGQVVEAVGPPGKYRGLSLSPDGKRIAVHRHEGSGGDVFVVEPKPREAFTRLTVDASHDNSSPIWSPDGKHIVYASLQKGKWGLYQTLSDRSGTAQLLFESEFPKAPLSWVGKRIVFWVQDTQSNGDLWVLDMENDKDRTATPFIHSTFNETHGQISPDGKWIAYTTNETGGRNEIFVRPFPTGSDVYQVSDNGGGWPRWRHDSKELYYHAIGNLATPGVQTRSTAVAAPHYAVSVSATGATFEPGKPRDILQFVNFNAPHSGGSYQIYDVSDDGQRILLFQAILPGAQTAAVTAQVAPDPPNGLVIALHWLNALKK